MGILRIPLNNPRQIMNHKVKRAPAVAVGVFFFCRHFAPGSAPSPGAEDRVITETTITPRGFGDKAMLSAENEHRIFPACEDCDTGDKFGLPLLEGFSRKRRDYLCATCLIILCVARRINARLASKIFHFKAAIVCDNDTLDELA